MNTSTTAEGRARELELGHRLLPAIVEPLTPAIAAGRWASRLAELGIAGRYADAAELELRRELELERSHRARARYFWRPIMFALEVICATAGVAAFLAAVDRNLAWSAVFAIAAAVAYWQAEEVERCW